MGSAVLSPGRWWWAGAVVLGFGVAGCGTFGLGGGASLRVDSLQHSVRLEPALATSIYRSASGNEADLVISSLSEQELASLGAGATGLVGSILHVNMFLTPRAGRTPIEFGASNSAVTLVVLTGEGYGLYRGGGFLLPDGEPGGARFGGRIVGANLRLSERSPGFADRLGLSELSGRVRAERDEALTSAVIDRIAVLIAARGSADPEP